MQKNEIELIIINVSTNDGIVLDMKIYKNGTICRAGAGGLPEIGISMMSMTEDKKYFESLMQQVPDNLLEQAFNYEEETPNGFLQYVVAFYGVSSNGDNGERAEWSKSTGLRVQLDQQSSFNHPIMRFFDGFAQDAAEITNGLYFDAIVKVKYDVTSTELPEQTIISAPNNQAGIDNAFSNYVHQMLASARQWDMNNYTEFKAYKKDDQMLNATINKTATNFSIDFSVIPNFTEQLNKKKPWWKRLFS